MLLALTKVKSPNCVCSGNSLCSRSLGSVSSLNVELEPSVEVKYLKEYGLSIYPATLTDPSSLSRTDPVSIPVNVFKGSNLVKFPSFWRVEVERV